MRRATVSTLMFFLMAILLGGGAFGADVAPDPPAISVIYPHDGQTIGPVDSTFVLGSVTPGARLEINGVPIDVYRTGGFLAFLSVRPGPFVFRLRAVSEHGSNSVDVQVMISDPKPIPPDSGIRIREGSIRPQWGRTIRALDEVNVGFDGTVGGRARFWVLTRTDILGPFSMTELRRESLSTFRSYRRDALYENDRPPDDTPPSRGRYHGIWRVPPGLPDDSLRVLVELTGPSAQSVQQQPWPDSILGPPTPRDTTTETVRELAPGGLLPVDGFPPWVVELTDSVQILRMGPRLGYLTIFQPFGTRARWWGEAGPWTILQPVPGYEAWVETAKTRLLPDGTPIPGSNIARLSTESRLRAVLLRVGTSERLPFKVTVSDDLREVRILVFGATSNTDWIEQDPQDDLIEHIGWSQVQPRVYQVDVRLKEPLWGYDARYEERTLVVEFRRPPLLRNRLRGLTVAVDPGHSADPGAIGPTGLKEKDANLRIALELRKALKDMGVRVVMTRLDDRNVALYDRPALAVAQKADLYVSIHNNAVPDGINPRIRNGSATYYYHPFSRSFARHVHRRLLQATKLDDHGLTQGNFAVIRPTQYPSILVECAFIILPEQEEMLQTREFVERTARGIAAGIADFLRDRLER